MLRTKVAIVSKTPEVTFEEVAHVASALTMQVSRDFNPMWGIGATVMANALANGKDGAAKNL